MLCMAAKLCSQTGRCGTFDDMFQPFVDYPGLLYDLACGSLIAGYQISGIGNNV